MDFFYVEYAVLTIAIVYLVRKMLKESKTDRDQDDYSTVVRRLKENGRNNKNITGTRL